MSTYTKLTDQIVGRSALHQEGGMSGNTIERVRLADGRELVHKRVGRGADWISRATGDRGRLVAMWDAGLFTRMPTVVDHAIVAVETDDDGWSVFMRDVSASLVPRHRRLDRASVARVLRAVADLHFAFWGEQSPELCPIEDRYLLLSPRTHELELALGNPADWALRGWEAFAAHVPRTIADVVTTLLQNLSPLADELRTYEQTLIHGDLRVDNLGFDDGCVVLLDWGSQSGWAPPSVELMWFLGFDALLFDCTREDVIADFRALYGDRIDDRQMALACIGGFVHLGCHFGLGLLGQSPTMSRLGGDDVAKQVASQAELSWWIRAVDRALETWSPS